MGLFIRLAFLLLHCVPASADFRFILPDSSGVFDSSVSLLVRVDDSNVVPVLSDLFNHYNGVYTGNNTNPLLLSGKDASASDIFLPGYIYDQLVNIPRDVGPSVEKQYLLGWRSSLRGNKSVTVTNFSNRFTLTNMTGQWNASIISISNLASGKPGPDRVFSCGPTVCPSSVALSGLFLSPPLTKFNPSTTSSIITFSTATATLQIISTSTRTVSPSILSSPTPPSTPHKSPLVPGLAAGMGGLFIACCVILWLILRAKNTGKWNTPWRCTMRWGKKRQEHEPIAELSASQGPYDTVELPAEEKKIKVSDITIPEGEKFTLPMPISTTFEVLVDEQPELPKVVELKEDIPKLRTM